MGDIVRRGGMLLAAIALFLTTETLYCGDYGWLARGDALLRYTIYDGKASVCVYSCTMRSSVDIPSKIDGYPVTKVSGCYDASRTGLCSVTIPDSVTDIGYDAFKGCASLASVTIPNSVTNIGYCAFEDCSCLTSITIPDRVTAIGYKAFRECGLSEVSVSARTKIDESAFDSDVVITRCSVDEPTPLTWTGVFDEDRLGAVSTGGDAAWQMEAADGAQATATPKVGDSFAVSGAIAEGDETARTSWLKVAVNGKGTLSFWWKVDCEPDPRGRFTYDYGKVETNGTLVARMDGTTDWMQQTVTFDTDDEHEIVWTYVADGYTAMSGSYAGRIWLDGLSWSGEAVPVVPTVVGDDGATVTGDAETGFVVTPSEDATAVVVTIPSGVDAAKVTVVVAPDTQRVTPNGAAVKVVRGDADITDYLDIPAADASGAIDLNAATVKEEIAKEPFDAAKGAVIDFASPSKPSLTTAPTREGLVYRLKEGATLEAMEANTTGETKIGDGTSWTPTLSVTGGASGFYTIQVTK